MIISKTEHDLVMDDIMAFTGAIVAIAEMKNVHVRDKANAIYLAETVFHKMIMNKIVEKCVNKSIPSAN